VKLKHKKPCSECPWRKAAPQGWLGGHPPEYYADAAQNNEVPACHLQDFGPDDHKTAMCAGALATMANQCKAADNTAGGEAARRVVGRNNDCFPHLMAFYEYHAGKPYVHPILRDTEETPQ
jgi:hypothetical protein